MDLFQMSFANATKTNLTEFEIKNYRSIKEETISVSERGIVFTGENAIGKTTRIEALLWLLTGRLFDGSSNQLGDYIMPKDRNEDDVLSVSATFKVGMETYVFEKRMKDTTTYYVNGTPKKTLKDYNQALYRAFGFEEATSLIEKETKLLSKVDLMMLFTVLDFFPSLDNKTLRELVLLVGGDVKISELEMSQTLRDVLSKKSYDLDELKKAIKLRVKGDKNAIGIDKQLETVASQIKAHEKTLAGFGGVDDIETKKNRIEAIRKELATHEVDMAKSEKDLLADYDTQIAQVEAKIAERGSQKQSEEMAEINELETQLSELRKDHANVSNEIRNNKSKIESAEQTISFKEKTIESLKERGRSLVEQKKLIEKQNQITCPKCSEVFHVEHDHKNIEEIQSKLVALKKEIQETESGIKDLAKEVVSLRAIIEKSQIISDGIVAQGKTLADIVQNKRQTLILRRSEGFTQGDDLVFVQQLNTLKNAKSNASLELATSKNKTKTKMTNLQTELEGLYDFVSKISMYQNAQKEVETLSKQLKELQSTKNEFEQLEMEVKILEETWLRKIDENVASAFGENIKFKMFENNASNDNIAPTCEMYVKDSNGRWVNTINGINTGHGVPRLVEFITIVKKRLGIRDGLLLIDFFESIGKQAMEELLGYGQQIVATAVVKNQFELKKEDL